MPKKFIKIFNNITKNEFNNLKQFKKNVVEVYDYLYKFEKNCISTKKL